MSVMIKFYNRESHQKANSFGILLAAQLFLILLPAIFEYLHFPWIVAIATVFVIFSSLYIVTTNERDLFIGLFIGTIATILLLVDAPNPTETPDATFGDKVIAFGTIVWVTLLFTYIMVKLAQQVLAMRMVNLNVVLAAIVGYVLIGMIGGYLVRLVQMLTPGAFNIEPSVDGYTYMYFSFVTVTTLGYGDIAPQLPVGQALVIILAILGQMYLTIVIAMIIGQLIAKGTGSTGS